jgi:hypothetical protein
MNDIKIKNNLKKIIDLYDLDENEASVSFLNIFLEGEYICVIIEKRKAYAYHINNLPTIKLVEKNTIVDFEFTDDTIIVYELEKYLHIVSLINNLAEEYRKNKSMKKIVAE